MASQTRRAAAWIGYLLCCVWLAVALAWWVLSRFDYGYPLWYEVLDLQAHIATYAAQNPGKPGFGQLPPEQHLRAFTQIRQSVHGGEPPLETITYTDPAGRTVAMLTRDEIVHLRDVRQLFDRGLLASALLGLLWLPLAWLLQRAGRPSPRLCAGVLVGVGLAFAMPLIVAGPTAVFYQFHEWLFPPDHPWFFYWQDSLMSTLMKAPVLFGAIAAAIVPAALLPALLFYHGGLRLAAAVSGTGAANAD